MVVYDLTCPLNHHFEGWFDSAESFAEQRNHGQVRCPLCQSEDILRLPSAPNIGQESREPLPLAPASELGKGTAPILMVSGQLVHALRNYVVQQILAQTEDVGEQFASTARDIHHGSAPARNIRGVAHSHELAALQEEGIEVMILGIPDLETPLH